MRSFNRRRLSSRFGNHGEFNVPLPTGADGYTGRECPECDEHFRIMIGTGLDDVEDCYCPYCGFHEHHSHFHTKSQIDYASSVALGSIMANIDSELKQMARNFNRRSQRNQGLLNVTMEVQSTRPPVRLRFPEDLKLETHIECSNCTLKYAVYGVFAFCPDCGRRNAQQILENKLDLTQEFLEMAVSGKKSLIEELIGNALTSVVASFDSYGREMCRAYAPKSSKPSKAESIRFQNLEGAQKNVLDCFGFDIASQLIRDDWQLIIRSFQKRHLLQHRSGVVDEEYLAKANDPHARLGRKVELSGDEVRQLIKVVREMGGHFFAEMENLP